MPGALLTTVAVAFLADTIYFLQSTCLLFVIYFLLTFLSVKLARVVYITLCLSLILVQVGLTIYFGETSVLLGADLYSYSSVEISQTVGAAGGLSIGLLAVLVGVIGLVILIFQLVVHRIQLGSGWAFGLAGLGALAILFNIGAGSTMPVLETEYANNLVINKPAYLARATLALFDDNTDDGVDIYADAYIGDFGKTAGAASMTSINYLAESRYPFLHKDETPDVLGPFFNTAPTPPNVVIIIVEGLGRAFTGPDAYLGSFTPFIDSLAQQSLYWENFLSEGGLTFAVLPSIVGSLPFGQQGFADLGAQMPDHLSLPGILKKKWVYVGFLFWR